MHMHPRARKAASITAAIMLVIFGVLVSAAYFIMPSQPAMSLRDQAVTDKVKAIADADKSANAAQTAAVSARKAADSTAAVAATAEVAAQDTADSARDAANSVDKAMKIQIP